MVYFTKVNNTFVLCVPCILNLVFWLNSFIFKINKLYQKWTVLLSKSFIIVVRTKSALLTGFQFHFFLITLLCLPLTLPLSFSLSFSIASCLIIKRLNTRYPFGFFFSNLDFAFQYPFLYITTLTLSRCTFISSDIGNDSHTAHRWQQWCFQLLYRRRSNQLKPIVWTRKRKEINFGQSLCNLQDSSKSPQKKKAGKKTNHRHDCIGSRSHSHHCHRPCTSICCQDNRPTRFFCLTIVYSDSQGMYSSTEARVRVIPNERKLGSRNSYIST